MNKTKVFIGIGVVVLVVAIWLVYMNFTITGNVVKGKNNSDNSNSGKPDKIKDDCWLLDDGRKVCLLATNTTINAGDLTEIDKSVKEKNIKEVNEDLTPSPLPQPNPSTNSSTNTNNSLC